MVIAITRGSVTASADGARSEGKKTTSPGSGSALIARSTAARAATQQSLALQQSSAVVSIPQSLPSVGGWLLIDSDNMAWFANPSLTSFLPIGVKFPTNAAQFGNNGTMECNWNGKNWFFFDNEDWGFYRGNESATSWTLIQNIPLFVFHPTIAFTSDPNVIYICGQFIGLYKSTDGGLTFTQRTSAQYRVSGLLVFDPLGDLIVSEGRLIVSSPYSAGSIYTSDDDGVTWVQRTTSSNSLNANTLVKIGTTLYSGGSRGFLKSSNNGTSWSSFTVTPESSIVQDLKYTGSTYVAVVIRTIGGNQASGVGGPQWSPDIENVGVTPGVATDGTMLRGSFNTFRRQLRYDGSMFSFYDRNNGKCFKSSDGKVWSPVVHPDMALGKKFWIGFPSVADPNRNLA
jgi:hypothetical protein